MNTLSLKTKICTLLFTAILFNPVFAWVENSETECTLAGYSWIHDAHVNATWTFTDEVNGTEYITDWTMGGLADPGHYYIIDERGGRAKVLELYDYDLTVGSETRALTSTGFDKDKGNISYWFMMHDPANEHSETSTLGLTLIDSNNADYVGIILAYGTGSFGAVNVNSQISCAEAGAASQTLLGTITKDKWHYINIEFDTSSSTYFVTLDDNPAVECSVYSSWGDRGATGFTLKTGPESFFGSGSQDHFIWYDAINFDWLTQNNVSIAQCCGNDGTIDETFYNGSLSSTMYFCHQGQYINREIDANQILCSYYNYTWMFDNKMENITYSFSNYDTGATNIANWSIGGGAVGGYGQIVDNIDGRNKVVELYDPDTNPDVEIFFLSSADFPISKGVVSFYFRMADSSQFGIMELFKTGGLGASPVLAFGTATLGAVSINSQITCVEAGAASQTMVGSITQDTWHSVEIEFNTSSSTFQVSLDSAEKVECGLYDEWSGSDATTIFFQTGGIISSGSPTHYIWLDEIYIDWSPVTDKNLCCGDDNINDTFYNSTSVCSEGAPYICGVFDGVCPEDLGFPVYCPSDPDCHAYPDNTYSLCANASTTWTWIPDYRTGASPYCCGNNETSDNWLGLSNCCYKGHAMQSGNISNSLYCLNGYLYDCNNQVSDAGGVETNIATGVSKGRYYCLSNNTWAESYYTSSTMEVTIPKGALVSGNTYAGAVNFTITNPLNEHQDYELKLEYDKGYSHFSATGSNKMTVKVAPNSDFITYIDIFPVISGEMSFTLTLKSINNPNDYLVKQFSINIVPTQKSAAGGVYYFDEISIFEIAVNFINQLIVLII